VAKRKLDNLTVALESVRKQFGKDSIKTGDQVLERTRMPTGFEQLDTITAGGLPEGQITIIWGAQGAGKSTLAYAIAGNKLANSDEDVVIVADIENQFDPVWAGLQGCGGQRCLVLPVAGGAFEGEATLEKMLDRILATMKACRDAKVKVAMVVVDSIHGMATQQEIASKKGKEHGMEHDTIATLPKKITQFVRVATPRIARNDCAFVVIGQARDKIDMFGGQTLTGGHALKHGSRCTLRVSRLMAADKVTKADDGEIMSWRVKIFVEKINAATEGRSIELPFLKGVGFDDLQANIERGVLLGHIIKKGGGYFEWREGVNIRGQENLVDYFRTNVGEYAILLERMRKPEQKDD